MSAVEWVLQSRGGVVADIGAGTGALTRSIEKRADDVIAIEPDGRMLGVLRSRLPGISAIRGVAEHLPIRSGRLDAVTISSAWHWMDPETTVAEIGRVLRPGGVLGVIWNGADRSVEWVTELLGTRDPSPGDRVRWSRHRLELPSGAPFEGIEGNVLHWSTEMTRAELVGLAGTYSSMITMNPAQRERELDRVEAAASAITGGGKVGVPMSCRCWRAVRK